MKYLNYAETASERHISPVEAAYNDVRHGLDELGGLLGSLESKLGPAMRPPEPVAGQLCGPKSVDPMQSELHGMLMGTAERLHEHCRLAESLLQRLTI